MGVGPRMTEEETSTAGRKNHLAIALIVSMFAIWGLAHRLYDTLLPQFAAALALNDFTTNLAQWALSFGYFLMALPAAMVTRNFGYKSGVVFGLGCFSVGMFLFYPAAHDHGYYFFLLAAVVVGSGLAMLEVSADPLIVRLGSVKTAVRRLNIAQTMNPIGILAGFFVGNWVVSSDLEHPVAQLAHSLVEPYFIIGAGVLLFAFFVDNVKFPAVAGERVSRDARTVGDFRKLLAHNRFLLGAGALLLCSVTQVVLWGFTIRYAQHTIPGMTLSSAKDILLWALIAFTIGRVIGTALMYAFDPSILLAAFAAAGAAFALGAAFTGGETGVQCIIAASFFLSIVFPTIFGNAIRDLGPLTKAGSAMMMLAAGSGAAALAIANLVCPPDGVQHLMLVSAAGFAGIAAYGAWYYATDPMRRAAEPSTGALHLAG
jgi:MFS transporter, FHS family, L-fucose permease